MTHALKNYALTLKSQLLKIHYEGDQLQTNLSMNPPAQCTAFHASQTHRWLLWTRAVQELDVGEAVPSAGMLGCLPTSSAEHAQSNGLAERTVRSAKQLMERSHRDGTDVFLNLLNIRNIPRDKTLGQDRHAQPSLSVTACSRRLQGAQGGLHLSSRRRGRSRSGTTTPPVAHCSHWKKDKSSGCRLPRGTTAWVW